MVIDDGIDECVNSCEDEREEDDMKDLITPSSSSSIPKNQQQDVLSSRSLARELLSQRYLSNDTFSFIIYNPHWSIPSLLAKLVFCLHKVLYLS